jgi:hypothetical protein
MNSAHSAGFRFRSKGAQFSGDGSMDGDFIELQDTAARPGGEVTPAA